MRGVPVEKLGNLSASVIDTSESDIQPMSAAIYQIDGVVRRASSLQMTADAKLAVKLSTNAAQEVIA
jgi:NADH-quinone oxidoreductase subunit G